MTTSTTLPILDGLVKRGLLQSFKLETLQEIPGEHSREHDRLTLVFPNGEPLVIDTICSGCLENCEIHIDNATAPGFVSANCKCGHPSHIGYCKERDYDPSHGCNRACGCQGLPKS